MGAKDHWARSAFRTRSTTEIAGFYRFVESARVGILEPLLHNSGLRSMHLAVSICSSLLQKGWLCSIQAVEESAVTIAKTLAGLLGAETELGNFVIQLLHHSSTAAAKMESVVKCGPKAKSVGRQRMQFAEDTNDLQESPDTDMGHSQSSKVNLLGMSPPEMSWYVLWSINFHYSPC